ncbi:hypothetical protein HMPREF1982_00594 [Clostridiales bacterium oral taxon 876 str. F0540]|nr:hypothetical protein HMPREF1982_00594 [Clostridiales bacterium oral taxon 876 str. F0540]
MFEKIKTLLKKMDFVNMVYYKGLSVLCSEERYDLLSVLYEKRAC